MTCRYAALKLPAPRYELERSLPSPAYPRWPGRFHASAPLAAETFQIGDHARQPVVQHPAAYGQSCGLPVSPDASAMQPDRRSPLTADCPLQSVSSASAFAQWRRKMRLQGWLQRHIQDKGDGAQPLSRKSPGRRPHGARRIMRLRACPPLHRTYGCTGWRPNPDPKKTDRVWCQCKMFQRKNLLVTASRQDSRFLKIA